MALEAENETYRRELPNLLSHIGKFALIRGEQIVDFFDSYEDALKAGYQKFGLETFMVKRVQATEQVLLVTRLATPCPI